MNNDSKESTQSLTWIQMISSTCAAIIGVQSKKNKERDFAQGDIKKFIIVAIGLTGLLLFSLIGLVQVIIN